MYYFLAYAYEFLSEFIPFLIVMMLSGRPHGNHVVPRAKRDYAIPIIFACYIIAVFHVTGAGTIYDAMTFQFEDLEGRVNLIPFSDTINVVGYLLNVVMFIPLGFLVPLMWKRMGKFWDIVLAGFSLSILIELSQLLCLRGTDVDDLILNTLGAVVGFFLYKAWDKLTVSKYQLDEDDILRLPVYILALYLGRFLLFNQLGLINFVYG